VRWSFGVGKIAGIRIEIHVTFVLFVGWIALSRGLGVGDVGRALEAVLLLLLVFGCVLLHELGHAMAARRYGIRTRDIILLPFGGVARLERMPERPQEEIVVAIAGPMVNVVLAGVLFFFVRDHILVNGELNMQGGILEVLFFVNVVMLLFNLIPAFPMDGGRVLRALLALRLSYAQATRIASIVGQAVAIVFGIVGLLNQVPTLIFVALFVFLAAGEERSVVESRAALSGIPVRAAMVTDFAALDASDPLQRAVDHLMSGSQQDFPVLSEGRFIGVLSRKTLVTGLQKNGAEASIGSVIEPYSDHADAQEPLEQALQRMRANGRSVLPVLHHGALVGLITLENVGELLLVQNALRRHSRPA